MSPTFLFTIAAAVFGFALLSHKSEKGLISAPMAFAVAGVALALVAPGYSVPNAVLHGLAEVTLVFVLFADASRIDVRHLRASHDVPLRLLGIGLPLAMALGTAVAWLVFGLTFWQAAVIGVVLAPTDAALGQAVVTDRRVPERIRQGLNVESGLNDGLAFPVLLLVASLAFAGHEQQNLGEWLLFVARQLLLGPLVGALVGWAGAALVERSSARGWMTRPFLQVSTLSLAILAFAGAELVSGNGFIAAFLSGMVVGTRSRHLVEAIEDFGETEIQLLTLLVFLAFGAVLLPQAWDVLSWRHALYALLSLTVVRLVPTALALWGTRLAPVTVAFLGWFGPRGLASVLYLLLIVEEHAPKTAEATRAMAEVHATVLITVAASIVLHGLSAVPVAGAYAAWLRRHDGHEQKPEHRSVVTFAHRFGRRTK